MISQPLAFGTVLGIWLQLTWLAFSKDEGLWQNDKMKQWVTAVSHWAKKDFCRGPTWFHWNRSVTTTHSVTNQASFPDLRMSLISGEGGELQMHRRARKTSGEAVMRRRCLRFCFVIGRGTCALPPTGDIFFFLGCVLKTHTHIYIIYIYIDIHLFVYYLYIHIYYATSFHMFFFWKVGSKLLCRFRGFFGFAVVYLYSCVYVFVWLFVVCFRCSFSFVCFCSFVCLLVGWFVWFYYFCFCFFAFVCVFVCLFVFMACLCLDFLFLFFVLSFFCFNCLFCCYVVMLCILLFVVFRLPGCVVMCFLCWLCGVFCCYGCCRPWCVGCVVGVSVFVG